MSNRLSSKINQLYNSDKLPWIIICVGIILRLIRYLHNPSFWFDEAVGATDIINRSYTDFINPSPDYDGGYPFVFLVLIKSTIQVFGNSEYAFRLLPLIFGILSLFLFYRVAKYYISPKAVPLALALFAISDPLVLFSSEFKPYSVDITFALLIYTYITYIQSIKLNAIHIILFAILGASTLWISNPSVFVLAGIGAGLTLSSLRHKDWPQIRRLVIVFSVWTLSFLAVYFIYIRNSYANIGVGVEKILEMEHALMPFPPKSFGDIKWFVDNFFGTFDYPVGITLTGIAALAFLVGCRTIFIESKDTFLVLMLPVLFTLLAAALHKYPFKGRLILFLVPLLLLFIAQGAERLWNISKNNSVITGLFIIGILLIYPLMWSAHHIVKPMSREEIKPVLTYIKNHWQEGDILYVHFYSQYSYDYYSKYHPRPYTFNKDEYIIGIAPRQWYTRWKRQDLSKYYPGRESIIQSRADILKEYIKDLDRLTGHKRVWMLFTGDIPGEGIKEDKFFTFQLDTAGKRLDFFGRSGVCVTYLYDLSGPDIKPGPANH